MTVQRTSVKGRDFIARQEGVVPFAYNDSRNNATFGIGHLIHLGPVSDLDKIVWGTKRKPRDHADVMAVFNLDVQQYEAAVRDAIGRNIAQPAFDACVSLCINIGKGAFAESSVARDLRDHKWREAADAILLFAKIQPELLPRRKRERTLFLTGDYGA